MGGVITKPSINFKRLRCAIFGHVWSPWEVSDFHGYVWQRTCKRQFKLGKGCYTFQFGGYGQRVNYRRLRIEQP